MPLRERDSKDEFQQLRSELQLMMEEKQASSMQGMREMMAELMRNNAPSKSSSAEGSAAVRGSSAEDSAAVRGSKREVASSAARQTSAAAAATGGGARGDTCATAREMTLREDASCKFGVTGRRGAAAPVEVGPARDQPDQQRRAGE